MNDKLHDLQERLAGAELNLNYTYQRFNGFYTQTTHASLKDLLLYVRCGVVRVDVL